MLKFKLHVEEPIAATPWEAFVKADKFPRELVLSELNILSIIKMSRTRNKELHCILGKWYKRIDSKFRLSDDIKVLP